MILELQAGLKGMEQLESFTSQSLTHPSGFVNRQGVSLTTKTAVGFLHMDGTVHLESLSSHMLSVAGSGRKAGARRRLALTKGTLVKKSEFSKKEHQVLWGQNLL